MNEYFSPHDRLILQKHGLDSFEALWALQLDAVDAPNTGRGGSSSVFRLDLGEAAYYLKRQSNYLTRTLRRPFGEPTFAREFRNIQRYQGLGIPTLEAAYFGERRVGGDRRVASKYVADERRAGDDRRVRGERRAILLTRALDDWQDLHSWLDGWAELDAATRKALLLACADLARTLHQAGQRHGCFYPKHIFLRPAGDRFEACLIDLEKTRPLFLGRTDRAADLETLFRRARIWDESEVRQLIEAYLPDDANEAAIESWLKRIAARQQSKATHA